MTTRYSHRRHCRARILNEGFDSAGRSIIAMWSDPRTIYERWNGTFFFRGDGKRHDVELRADGTFYHATRAAPA